MVQNPGGVQSVKFTEGKYLMNNRTLLLIVGVILLCCCVVVIAGAVAYPTVSKFLKDAPTGLNDDSPAVSGSGSSSGPVDGSLGNDVLKHDTWNAILKSESSKGCNNVTSMSVDVVQQPNKQGVWIEDWSINACGKDVVLEITFTLDSTGTTYQVKQK